MTDAQLAKTASSAEGVRPRVIFDSHHPKHYLTVRALGRRCLSQGIEVVWTAREKDVLVDLMRQDGIDPIVLTAGGGGLASKLLELAVYDWKLARLARRVQPRVLMGKAISLAHVGRLLGIPSILINDDSAAANPQYRYLGYPFAHRILTAECLGENYGPRQRNYPGLMELAYLHPDAFAPDPAIRDVLGLAPGERLFVLRLAAFKAYHDVGQQGLSPALVEQLIARLSQAGRLYIVSETPLVGEYAQYKLPVPANRLHHVLAASDLVLGDGLTVCVEAALLGRPAIAFGSYIGKHAYTRVLEDRFGLLHGFTPDRTNEFLDRVEKLLRPGAIEEAAKGRCRMLSEWRNPTDVYWEELGQAMNRAAGRASLAHGAKIGA